MSRAYVTSFGRSRWRQLLCVILGHDVYAGRGWYFDEWGCCRCGIRFVHQWDLFDHQPYGGASSDIREG